MVFQNEIHPSLFPLFSPKKEKEKLCAFSEVVPGHADEIMGRDDLHCSSSIPWLCLYLMMNSLQDSRRAKSLLQLVSKTAFTPKDLKKVASFLKT